MPGAPEEQTQPARSFPLLPRGCPHPSRLILQGLVPSYCGQGKAELQLCMALCSQVWWAGFPEPTEPLALSHRLLTGRRWRWAAGGQPVLVPCAHSCQLRRLFLCWLLLWQLGWLLPQLLPSGPADSDPSSASISLLLGGSRDVQGISPAISHAGKKYVHNFPSSTAPLAHTLTAAL